MKDQDGLVFIATCIHTFNENEHENPELPLTFLSAFEKRVQSGIAEVLPNVHMEVKEVCSEGYIGLNGAYDLRPKVKSVIDFMLLPIGKHFLSNTRVDIMTFRINRKMVQMEMLRVRFKVCTR